MLVLEKQTKPKWWFDGLTTNGVNRATNGG